MGKIVGYRSLNQLSWAAEGDGVRTTRRSPLCELDGLLNQLEDINVRGVQVPGRVRIALQRHGIMMSQQDGAAEMIEAIFVLQERYMLRPEQGAPNGRTGDDLRRRLAV